MSAIAADPSKLDTFCWLMTELGKGGVPENGDNATIFLERMAQLGPVFERSFDLDPASPAGINFEESVTGLYERCDK